MNRRAEWTALILGCAEDRRKRVAEQIKLVLADVDPVIPITTEDVVERCLPLEQCHSIQIEARTQLFGLLNGMKLNLLSDCCLQGTQRTRSFGGTHYLWYWHAATGIPNDKVTQKAKDHEREKICGKFKSAASTVIWRYGVDEARRIFDEAISDQQRIASEVEAS